MTLMTTAIELNITPTPNLHACPPNTNNLEARSCHDLVLASCA